MLVTAAAAVAMTVALPFGAADYTLDAGPAIAALSRLDLHGYLAAHPLMGPGSIAARAPAVAAARLLGLGSLDAYRLGMIPCLLALGALGGVLVCSMRAAGRSTVAVAVVAIALVADPLNRQALVFGHPEELLAGTLAVAAVLAAPRRALAGGVLAGLAVATKQWALIAVAPAVLASSARARTLAGAAATAVLAYAPGAVGDLHAFATAQRGATDAAGWVGLYDVWWPLARASHRTVHDTFGTDTVTRYLLPGVLGRTVHPLVVLACLALSVPLLRRRPTLDSCLSLLALACLVRCALDPWNTAYYAVPLAIALITRDALARDRVPLAGPAALIALNVVFLRFPVPGALLAHSVSYLVVAGALGAWLALRVYAPTRVARWGEALTRPRREARETRPRAIGPARRGPAWTSRIPRTTDS